MLLSLLALGGAIALFRMTRLIPDEIVKIVGGLVGLACLMMSLVLAPWLLKLAIVVALLILPNCVRPPTKPPAICPRFCIARGRCHLPQSSCLGWGRSPLCYPKLWDTKP